jgi:hypothetical protein
MAATLSIVAPGNATTGEKEYKASFDAECELAPGLLNEKGTIKVTTKAFGPEEVHKGEEVTIHGASATITTPANWSSDLALFGAVTARGNDTALEVNATGVEPAALNIAKPSEYPSGLPFETPVESGKAMTLSIPSGPEAKGTTFALAPVKVMGEPGTRVKLELSTAKGFEGTTDTHKGIQTTVSGYNASGSAVISGIAIGCTAPSGVVLGEVPIAPETYSSSSSTSSTTTTTTTSPTTTTTTTSPTTTTTTTSPTTTTSSTITTTTATTTVTVTVTSPTTTTTTVTYTLPTTITTTATTTATVTSPTTTTTTVTYTLPTTITTTATTIATVTSPTTTTTTVAYTLPTTITTTATTTARVTSPMTEIGTTSPTVALPVGTAVADPVGSVSGRAATIVLRCAGAAACRGSTRLVARLVERHRVKRHGRRAAARNVVVGTSRFSVPAGGSVAIRVHLTAKGHALVMRAGRRALKVTASGSGMRAATLVLKGVGRVGKRH